VPGFPKRKSMHCRCMVFSRSMLARRPCSIGTMQLSTVIYPDPE
jgi:hypothetical protein